MSARRWFKLLLLTVAVVAAALAIWQLSGLLFLVFGASLVALVLGSAKRLVRRTGLPDTASLAVAVVAIFLFIAGFAMLLGTRIYSELVKVADRLPQAITSIEAFFGINNADDWLSSRLQEMLSEAAVLSNITSMSSIVTGAVIAIFLVVSGGIYFASRPGMYISGFLKLMPDGYRDKAEEVIEASANALRQWMVGQLVSMLAIGILTTVGLYLLGVPTAFGLGALAGFLEFIPYLGPIISAIPAIAVGFAESPSMALWVALLYFGIQQAEAALLVPIIQERAVDLPPGLTIFAVVAAGILFGWGGAILAAPLTVLIFVVVKKLWVRDTLHEKTDVPGEDC